VSGAPVGGAPVSGARAGDPATDRARGSADIDVAALRRDEFAWMTAGDQVYLNAASTGPLPARTIATAAEWAARRAQPHRIGDAEQMEILATTRAHVAALVGADAAEIALAPNTSYGINVAARALPLAPGDVVVSVDREFPANVYPWMAQAARGVRFEQLACVDDLPDEEALLRAVARPEVKAVTVSWVQFSSGHRVDLARLGALCRACEKWLVVDAIQGVGAVPLDLAALHVDVLACGMQKWLLAPWGTGFVYVRRALHEVLPPPDVGWLAVRGADDYSRLVDYDFTLRDDARRFEVGTLAYEAFAAATASLALLHALGPDAVAAHVVRLCDAIVAWAASRDDVRLVTRPERARRGGIVSVAPRDPVAASRRLRAAGIVHSLREGAIRLAPHCYNTEEDVARALAVLGEGA